MTLFAAAVSVAAIAKTEVWVWKNGTPVYVHNADSITFSEPVLTDVYSDGTEAGHNYVDLGLTSGTKWATMNIGAETPQDYGNYYAWGEIYTKENYKWSTYKYGSGEYELTKYCTELTFGKDDFTDSKTTLDHTDDAVMGNWGNIGWRIPTKDQFDELLNECYWVWTDSYNGSNVEGYIVYKAKSSSDKGVKIYSDGTPSSSYSLSDAHIFLPLAGVREEHRLIGDGISGWYWSSTLFFEKNPSYARGLSLSLDVKISSNKRCYGLPVRAVFK
ncbi:MAG: hypothetical protein IKM57_05795 [Paludibacteraceae bacterium]|nr:hypothetical protein [Paludibacteraceae bacterium]